MRKKKRVKSLFLIKHHDPVSLKETAWRACMLRPERWRSLLDESEASGNTGGCS